MVCGGGCLSDLPDELLLRVLHFLPAKDAASTTALSKRWRAPLWRSSGAVNIETRVEDSCASRLDDAIVLSRRDAFLTAAGAELDAADVRVTRLTLRFEFGHVYFISKFLNHYTQDGARSPDKDVLPSLLSHRAARSVEELRLDAHDCGAHRIPYDPNHHDEDEISPDTSGRLVVGAFVLSLGSLPSEHLRVLDITNCRELVPLPPADAVVFPRLSSVRLRRCTVRLDALQSAIDAAPALATVHLDSVVVVTAAATKTDGKYVSASPLPPTKALLRSPAATLLVMERCGWMQHTNPSPYHRGAPVDVPIEIDAPRLRRFRYKGHLRPFSLSPPPPGLARADLHFVPRPGDNRSVEEFLHEYETAFWGLLQSFTGTKEMKLSMNPLEDMAVLSEARRAQLLPKFSNLDRLELHGVHRPKGKTAAVAIANLLRCCPTLRDLRISLNEDHGCVYDVETIFRADREKTVGLLNRLRSSGGTAVSPAGSIVTRYGEVPDISCLSRRSFDCLNSSLRRVGLQFRLYGVNSLGVRLIKFFAENAMVLQEMCIDGGNEKLDDHITRRVQRWIADSSVRRKPGASTFVVLPLRR